MTHRSLCLKLIPFFCVRVLDVDTASRHHEALRGSDGRYSSSLELLIGVQPLLAIFRDRPYYVSRDAVVIQDQDVTESRWHMTFHSRRLPEPGVVVNVELLLRLVCVAMTTAGSRKADSEENIRNEQHDAFSGT